ncbi:Integrase catalytic domain-containing protein [Aphis craccivora]|uniref:Integrase catalytic domain-containing protein n=1 Tax=Aphis craccivora TaxID=307492 RepID=A0A6G0ZH15_APHCR|nr:Integrase catalytic domain-containing protein [Aphis craccivora]
MVTLQGRQKWLRQDTNLNVGVLVVVKSPGRPFMSWQLGRWYKMYNSLLIICIASFQRREDVGYSSGMIEDILDHSINTPRATATAPEYSKRDTPFPRC